VKNNIPKLVLYLLLPIIVFLSLNKHSKDKEKSYHDVIWADAAGYYVYNAIWHIYDHDIASYPDSIDIKTGNGFLINTSTQKIETKYYSGTALLQTPFFYIAHILAKPLGYEANGFSKIYAYGLYFAGIVYAYLGLFFLYQFLKRRVTETISLLTVILLFACTNLFYYSIDAPGMSHVYSFFVFSLIIYLTPKFLERASVFTSILYLSLIMLAVLIRPTNLFICIFPIVYNLNSFKEIPARIQQLIKPKLDYLLGGIAAIAMAIPQFLYWKSISGNLLNDAYKNETFSNWNSPKLLEVWFSTNNGLFTYTPIAILFLLGLFFLKKKHKTMALGILVTFLVISYVCASWWNWWFGCSFGARSFVEYYALLILPFAYLLKSANDKKGLLIFLVVFIGFSCYLNLSIEYYYDGCFYGETWDFTSFFKLI
jgi:hypothetical protein